MNTSVPPRLRTYIREKDPAIGKILDFLWYRSEDIHDRMNRSTKPEANESGPVHVQMVENNLWRLLNEYDRETGGLHLDRFETYELFLMSAAVCCHDFDKAHLPDGYKHGVFSGAIVVENHEILGLTRQQANAIKQVIEIHDLKNHEFIPRLDKLTDNTVCPLGTIELRLIATLLKTADILHTDESRISTLVYTFTESSGANRLKYLARYCTDGWRIEGPKVIVVATPENQEQELAFRASFSWMKKNEWSAVENALREYRFPYFLEAECPNNSGRTILEIIIEANIEEFGDENLSHFEDVLIYLLNITVDDISEVMVLKGSIIILAIPLESVFRLKQLAENTPNRFTLEGIKALGFEDGTRIIFKDDDTTTVTDANLTPVTATQDSKSNTIKPSLEELEIRHEAVDDKIMGKVTKKQLLDELLRMFPRIDRFVTILEFHGIPIIKELYLTSPMETYMNFIIELNRMPPEEQHKIFKVLSLMKPGSDLFRDLSEQ